MAGILGGDGLASVFGMLRGFGMDQGGYGGGRGGGRGSGGVGHLAAAGIGGGLLWALAASLVSLVYLLGLNLVYLRVTEGLDVGATEAAMQAGFDDAKRRAAELSQKAKDAAERARAQARASAAAGTVPAAAAAASAARLQRGAARGHAARRARHHAVPEMHRTGRRRRPVLRCLRLQAEVTQPPGFS